jgi:mannose-1-phosphate guanylyltransferase/mannose-6-phosphate isomerase-like protein (cupin superfamily)
MRIGVILCGGSGTRLYPLSTEYHPKQFCKLLGEKTLFEMAIERLLICNCEKIILVYHDKYFSQISSLISNYNINFVHAIERYSRNTGGAILLALTKIHNENDEILVIPSDHFMDDDLFSLTVQSSKHLLESLILFGITPNYPETGFGYIECKDNKVISFHEKPSLENALFFLSKGFLWNSGCFYGTKKVFDEEIMKYANLEYQLIKEGRIKNCQNTPFDKLILEKSSNVCCMPYTGIWSDMGNWKEVFKYSSSNIINKDCTEIHCLTNKPIQIIKSNNILVVMDKDKDYSSTIKTLPISSSVFESKPWGCCITLDKDKYYSTKKITLRPKTRTSLQMHRLKTETITVISGRARILIDNEIFNLDVSSSIVIPRGSLHRITNIGDGELIFIEVHSGLIDEKDIEIIEDD